MRRLGECQVTMLRSPLPALSVVDGANWSGPAKFLPDRGSHRPLESCGHATVDGPGRNMPTNQLPATAVPVWQHHALIVGAVGVAARTGTTGANAAHRRCGCHRSAEPGTRDPGPGTGDTTA